MTINALKCSRETLILMALFCVHLLLFWPGYMTSDSQGQYNMAVSGVYSDHHPFIMSFLWRYLDKIYPGPGLMLFTHFTLLYGSVYFFMRSFPNSKLRYYFFAFPFFPHVLSYSPAIWKDNGFAFTFLFVASYLAYCTMENRVLKGRVLMGLLVILAYGTLVKFQAQYLAPLLLLWMGLHQAHYQKGWNLLKKLAIISFLFYGLIAGVRYFGPEVKQDHSWQMVKFYDLAAMSVTLNKPLMPEFNRSKSFSMEELHKRFNHQRVDDLVFGDAILVGGQTEQERDILWKTWAHEVLKHPFIYLKHRSINMAYALLSTPLFMYVQPALDEWCGVGTIVNKTVYITARILGYLILAHFLPALLSFVYLGLALFSLHKTKAAIPLFFMSSLSVMMLGTLFFCSMAGTPRYTYIVVCMTYASHIFAYLCYKQRYAKTP